MLRARETRSFEQRTFRYAAVRDVMEAAIPWIREKASKMARDD
jgi:hypothetical protein